MKTPMKNPNTNCLEGMQCPKCKSYGPFIIAAETQVLVSDDGTEEAGGDTNWEDTSYCRCQECDRDGQVKDFYEKPHIFTPEQQRAFNQVLAALRYWQENFPSGFTTIGQIGRWSEYFKDENYDPMSFDEIDRLCETLQITF